MKALDIFNARLLPHALRIVGSRLVHVGYRVLKHEARACDIDRQGFYLGGEIKLRFEGTDPVYVSWDQNAGWPDGTIFSLLLSSETAFSDDGLDEFSANHTKIWSPHVGEAIECVTVFGIDEVPFVLCIETGNGTLMVGSSYREQFGDGDDVFVSNNVDSIRSMSPIWQSTKRK